MLCKPCEDRTPGGSLTRRPRSASCVSLCEQCGATIVTLKGVRLGVGKDTLAQLARFGLAERVLSHTDRKSTRLNSSHSQISYAVFCLKKKKNNKLHRCL